MFVLTALGARAHAVCPADTDTLDNGMCALRGVTCYLDPDVMAVADIAQYYCPEGETCADACDGHDLRWDSYTCDHTWRRWYVRDTIGGAMNLMSMSVGYGMAGWGRFFQPAFIAQLDYECGPSYRPKMPLPFGPALFENESSGPGEASYLSHLYHPCSLGPTMCVPEDRTSIWGRAAFVPMASCAAGASCDDEHACASPYSCVAGTCEVVCPTGTTRTADDRCIVPADATPIEWLLPFALTRPQRFLPTGLVGYADNLAGGYWMFVPRPDNLLGAGCQDADDCDGHACVDGVCCQRDACPDGATCDGPLPGICVGESDMRCSSFALLSKGWFAATTQRVEDCPGTAVGSCRVASACVNGRCSETGAAAADGSPCSVTTSRGFEPGGPYQCMTAPVDPALSYPGYGGSGQWTPGTPMAGTCRGGTCTTAPKDAGTPCQAADANPCMVGTCDGAGACVLTPRDGPEPACYARLDTITSGVFGTDPWQFGLFGLAFSRDTAAKARAADPEREQCETAMCVAGQCAVEPKDDGAACEVAVDRFNNDDPFWVCSAPSGACKAGVCEVEAQARGDMQGKACSLDHPVVGWPGNVEDPKFECHERSGTCDATRCVVATKNEGGPCDRGITGFAEDNDWGNSYLYDDYRDTNCSEGLPPYHQGQDNNNRGDPNAARIPATCVEGVCHVPDEAMPIEVGKVCASDEFSIATCQPNGYCARQDILDFDATPPTLALTSNPNALRPSILAAGHTIGFYEEPYDFDWWSGPWPSQSAEGIWSCVDWQWLVEVTPAAYCNYLDGWYQSSNEPPGGIHFEHGSWVRTPVERGVACSLAGAAGTCDGYGTCITCPPQPCKQTVVDWTTGTCNYRPVADGTREVGACAQVFECQAGHRTLVDDPCDDGNECTSDACSSDSCQHYPITGFSGGGGPIFMAPSYGSCTLESGDAGICTSGSCGPASCPASTSPCLRKTLEQGPGRDLVCGFVPADGNSCTADGAAGICYGGACATTCTGDCAARFCGRVPCNDVVFDTGQRSCVATPSAQATYTDVCGSLYECRCGTAAKVEDGCDDGESCTYDACNYDGTCSAYARQGAGCQQPDGDGTCDAHGACVDACPPSTTACTQPTLQYDGSCFDQRVGQGFCLTPEGRTGVCGYDVTGCSADCQHMQDWKPYCAEVVDHGDGTCEAELAPDTCVIDGNCEDAGPKADNPCLVCDPARDPHAWTALDDGTPLLDSAHASCMTRVVCDGGQPTHVEGNGCDDGDPCTFDACAWSCGADGAALTCSHTTTAACGGNVGPTARVIVPEGTEVAGAWVVTEQSAITLDGGTSSDPDGDALTYLWQVGGLLAADAGTASVPLSAPAAPPAGSTYTGTLTVCDPQAACDTASFELRVVHVNRAPSALATGPATVDAGAEVTLRGDGSSDPDGDALTFAWSQTAGASVTLDDATAVDPTFVAPEHDDALILCLTVYDARGAASALPSCVSIAVSAGVVAEPAVEPVAETSPEAVVEPGPEPVAEPSPEPVIETSPEQVVETSPEAVVETSPEPSVEPSPEPGEELGPEPGPEAAAEAVEETGSSMDGVVAEGGGACGGGDASGAVTLLTALAIVARRKIGPGAHGIAG
ncbi:MAG: hypothetical protein U1F43_09660 [Myxococcota bacterium]